MDDIIDSHIHCMAEHSQKLGEEIDREVDKLQEDESELMKMLETFEKTTMVGLDLIEYYENTGGSPLLTGKEFFQTFFVIHPNFEWPCA